METIILCLALGGGHYACPSVEGATVSAEAGEHVVVHTRDPEATSGEGWECRDSICTFDYGLAADDDAIDAPPGTNGGGCEPSPGPTPPAPPPRPPIFIDVRGQGPSSEH